jgi:hypothetical protein
MIRLLHSYAEAVPALISNNPALFLPVRDDHAIEISIAATLLALNPDNKDNLKHWFGEMINRASFAYRTDSRYPSTITAYGDLLSHPKRGDNDYRKNVTSGSILYPVIALWAGLLDDDSAYASVGRLKQDDLQHCNFQYWYPDERSEQHFYTNSDFHGATLSHVRVDGPKTEFLDQMFGECERSPHFKNLSAVEFGWWPLIIVACRHYRLPPPLHLIEGLRGPAAAEQG